MAARTAAQTMAVQTTAAQTLQYRSSSTDDGGTDDGSTDDGSTDDGLTLVPDFSLPDVNTTSSSFQGDVSPRDLNGNISVYYFGLATCTYCSAQFGHLDVLQEDLE